MATENTANFNEHGSVVIGIDVGGSTTKIVGFRHDTDVSTLMEPLFVRATDPITSIYGALGRFTSENQLSLSDIRRVMMTGVGSSHMNGGIYNLECHTVPEFSGVGLGGLYLSGLDEAIIVSMGTGTALVHAKREADGKTAINYLGGTGVGGGTLLGLTKKMLGVDTVEHIEQLCEGGDLSKINLTIRDISKQHDQFPIGANLTAANFGKLSDLATSNDIALGLCNMVAETIAMVAIFAARGHGIKNIVLTGNLTNIAPIRAVFEGLGDSFGVNFIIPDKAQFGTVIGAALYGG
ncbi:MAG: pantothenate kinase [Clostridia bacterium]|nr:pantothenate kinase [Clostridia bacterium]